MVMECMKACDGHAVYAVTDCMQHVMVMECLKHAMVMGCMQHVMISLVCKPYLPHHFLIQVIVFIWHLLDLLIDCLHHQ